MSSLAMTMGWFLTLPNGGLRWAVAALAVLLSYLLALCIWLLLQPRLSYANHTLDVRLRSGAPIQVPIDVVECFFLGQGPALRTRGFGDRGKAEETSTIVVRLAESAERWKHFDVNPALGQWCDGYITIRGTWCEPITNELLKRLNENLVAAHRELRSKKAQAMETELESAPPPCEQEVG